MFTEEQIKKIKSIELKIKTIDNKETVAVMSPDEINKLEEEFGLNAFHIVVGKSLEELDLKSNG